MDDSTLFLWGLWLLLIATLGWAAVWWWLPALHRKYEERRERAERRADDQPPPPESDASRERGRSPRT